MDDLLPYYESELGLLRRYSREFAERYPKIAGRLLLAGESSEDPHVERMIQSYALLNAKTAKRLDDDFPQLTEALLEVLFPHYLKPFPSCSIAKIDFAGASGGQSGAHVSRGTELTTHPVSGVACRFRTCYDVSSLPVHIIHVAFNPTVTVPDSVELEGGASISLTLKLDAEFSAWVSRNPKALMRVYLNADASFSAVLRNALFAQCSMAFASAGRNTRWQSLGGPCIHEVGFSKEEALIDFPSRSHPAYRLLTEYFSFPEKFNFIDIDLSGLGCFSSAEESMVTMHFLLSGIRPDSNDAKVLSHLAADNIQLGCTPVINLFKQRGEPIRVTHTVADYPVLVDARRPFAYEVHSIDSVNMVTQTPSTESVTPFRPLYSLRHGEDAERHGHFWVMRRDETLEARSPGHEARLSIVDPDFNPAAIETVTLSINLTATNRNLPASLAYGLREGDLFLEGAAAVKTISFLRKPTQSIRLRSKKGAHWRLISLLALGHLGMTSGGIDALKETLHLHNISDSIVFQKQIDSIRRVEFVAANLWMIGNPFSCLVRGTDVTVILDRKGFAGSAIDLFASVLSRFFGLYAYVNSYTRLIVVSEETGEELYRCPPRSGDLTLL